MIKLYWLSEIDSQDRPVVGEKAWMLSQLKQSGHPVFPGFVISSTVFREFLEKLNDVSSLLADFPASSLHLDVDNPRTLQLVAQQSRQSILNSSFPSQWGEILGEATAKLEGSSLILRSSLGGQFSLNQDISGLTPAQICWNIPENLEIAIKEMWAQLLSAKSLFYWQRLGIMIEQLNLGILVQPMVNAIASGVAINGNNYVEIQGNWGLGQSLLQGEVLADNWKINKLSGEVFEQELGNKTLAYRANSEAELSQFSAKPCLDSYLLSPEKQEQYCLNSDSILELYQLINNLQKHQIYWRSLEWILSDTLETSSPQLTIAQLIPLSYEQPIQETRSSTIINPPQSQLIGVAAAPGYTKGIVHLLNHDITNDSTQLAGSIIVTQKIHPFQLSSIKQASGVITEEGGITSHAAILARELGIPAVVGVPGATTWLQTGDSILLDGDNGSIVLNTLDEPKMSLEGPLLYQEKSISLNYPIGTKLMVNLSQPSSLEKVLDLPFDGLGLLRSELMLLDLCSPQSLQQWLDNSQDYEIVEKLKQRICKFADFFTSYPIFYRTFDDKFSVAQYHRGTAGYCFDSTLFRLELQALSEVQQQGYQNINIILPFVRTVDEFCFCRHLIEEFNFMSSTSFQLWIMAEVPSVIFELSDYVKVGVQGIAIGTNDLIPLLLGIDRNKLSSDHLSSVHKSAILGALKQLVQEAKRLQIPSSICGQIVVDSPQILEKLIQWGITTISVEPEAMRKTYQMIARIEQRLILEWAREKILLKNS